MIEGMTRHARMLAVLLGGGCWFPATIVGSVTEALTCQRYSVSQGRFTNDRHSTNRIRHHRRVLGPRRPDTGDQVPA